MRCDGRVVLTVTRVSCLSYQSRWFALDIQQEGEGEGTCSRDADSEPSSTV